MNKELELLESLYIGASRYQAEHGLKVGMALLIQSKYEYLKKALTPPTADEVCKALSEYYGRKVVFRENVFWYKTIIYDNEQWVRDVSLKDLSKDNRGDLITMIGKFYESLEGEKC